MRNTQKLQELRYMRHVSVKYKRLEELKNKINQHGEIKNVREYMVIANSIFGKDRIEARRRIITRRMK